MEKIDIDIVYVGYSVKMFAALLNTSMYKIECIITEKRCSDLFLKEAHKAEIPLFYVRNSDEVANVFELLGDNKNAIMYEFGLKIPDKTCLNNRIVNFHGGDLSLNRGANPLSWSILKPWIGAKMCAYQITGEWDCGYLITEKSVTISFNDTPSSLKKKLEKYLNTMIEKVGHFFVEPSKMELQYITGGVYRHRLQEKDYTIESCDYTENIIRKINSQEIYEGAIYYCEDRKIRIKRYRIDSGDNKEYLVLISKTGEEFVLDKMR